MTIEIPTEASLSMYLDDFREEVGRIDRLVFTPEHTFACIYEMSECPQSGGRRSRIDAVAHFFTVTPLPEFTAPNISLLPKRPECYALFTDAVGRAVEAMFRQGHADAGLRKLWFRSAVALVRARVLFRSNWFRGVRERTCASIRPHAGLFGETVFAEISRLPEMLRDTKHFSRTEIDVRLTQLLVDAALENGASETEALSFLTSA